ncbi:hypothetical protein HOLleu_21679 [Holothuria leucospilota]|uniref:Uncharacterized protein n=1 Tax=Holothuria leucospilota TaxID=206669 RepID=A0A9Q1BXU9_HOLLE|nr:hypothetical protein HOLleu_21679 [Holothuria leucospilota]
MEFRVGDSVQAIDELGRWEPARVLELCEGGYSVHFTNWAKIYDCVVKPENIRKPVSQFHHAVDVASKSRKRGKRVKFSQLCEGDVVVASVDGIKVDATVVVFDRFKQEVTVRFGEGTLNTIPVSDVSKQESVACQPSSPKQRRKQKPKQRTHVATPSLTVEEGSVTETPDNTGTGHKYFQVMNDFGIDVTCGECYRIEPGNISVFIKKIKKSGATFFADCAMVTSTKLDRDVSILVPVSRLVKDDVALSRADKTYANKLKRAAFWGSIQSGKDDGQIRSEQRTQQLALLVRKEVKLALASKTSHRTFSLGVSDLVVDMEVFQMDPFVHSRVSFSYLKGNLSHLDGILGYRWDILDRGANVSYVTRVVVAFSKGVLSMRVYTSICNGPVPNDNSYRFVLADNISQSDSIDHRDEVEELV